MKKRWGLVAVATFWTTAAIAAAMAFDAINEHWVRGAPIGALAVRHLTHVVLLGMALLVLLWITFEYVLATPLRKVAAGLYRIGTGRVEPLSVETRIREIHAIEHAINLMLERMKLNSPHHAVDSVQADIDALRAVTQSLPPLAEDQAIRLMEIATDLQVDLARLVHGESLVANEAREVQRRTRTGASARIPPAQ